MYLETFCSSAILVVLQGSHRLLRSSHGSSSLLLYPERERERERERGGWYNDADMVVQGSGIRTQALWTEMNRLLVSEISEIESTWVYSGVAAVDTLVM